ncbi:MAG: hypothetical protein SFT91_04445, partial [Rickettsiaceae bacterium]|nr:hypothetical protein [Rickettsiaceae bacterium]
SQDELKQHLHAYLMAYNFAKRLKAIKGKTPWQFILNQWTIHPEYFIMNPNHFLLGLNSPFLAQFTGPFFVDIDTEEVY